MSMFKTCSKRTHEIVICLSLSAVPVLFAAPVDAATLDLNVDALGLTNRGTDNPPEQVALVGGIGGRAAFTFTVRASNPDPDGAGLMEAPPIDWGFPVFEDMTTPWVQKNKPNTLNRTGFSGSSEGIEFEHNKPLEKLADGENGNNYYGSHPHIQLYLFKKTQPMNPFQLLGVSDLKHTFSTKHPNTPHFLSNSEEDTYSNNSNKDRDFLGPISELNFKTFQVKAHDHFGDCSFDKPMTTFVECQRDHGEHTLMGFPGHSGVGHELDHRLSSPVKELLTMAEGGNNPAGTKWFFAASYFVFDPAIGGREMNLKNNSVFREFLPGWDSTTTKFTPIWMGDSFRLKSDGMFMTKVPSTADGIFLEPITVPEPTSTLGLLALGTLGAGSALKRKQKQKAN